MNHPEPSPPQREPSPTPICLTKTSEAADEQASNESSEYSFPLGRPQSGIAPLKRFVHPLDCRLELNAVPDQMHRVWNRSSVPRLPPRKRKNRLSFVGANSWSRCCTCSDSQHGLFIFATSPSANRVLALHRRTRKTNAPPGFCGDLHDSRNW